MSESFPLIRRVFSFVDPFILKFLMLHGHGPLAMYSMWVAMGNVILGLYLNGGFRENEIWLGVVILVACLFGSAITDEFRTGSLISVFVVSPVLGIFGFFYPIALFLCLNIVLDWRVAWGLAHVFSLIPAAFLFYKLFKL